MNFENVVFPDSVGFECKNCGFCCNDEPPDVNLKEQLKIEAKGFRNFLEAPDGTGDRNICRKKDGSCVFFTEEKTCRIQDVKPSICKLEPFIITDYDNEKNMIFLELNPLAATTCKGIFTGEMENPQEIAKAAQNIIKEIQEITAENTGLPVTDRKVAAITRKLIKKLNGS